jgi:phosphoribosylformylglycinamidine synthase
MDLEKARACVLRVGGTNCDLEVKVALEELGLKTDVLLMSQMRSLADYQLLVFPGGFSYGDYVRAGAIWGKEVYSKMGKEIEAFADGEGLVLGICNGFQVLIEAGLLPGNGREGVPTAALANNVSARYECRWVRLRVEGMKSPFTAEMKPGQVLKVPVGHGEGRLLLPPGGLDELKSEGGVVFRYAMADGEPSNGRYPENPNGSVYDIAGICNRRGNVLGLMPHPERAFFGWQLPERRNAPYGDGRELFAGAIEYIKKLSL